MQLPGNGLCSSITTDPRTGKGHPGIVLVWLFNIDTTKFIPNVLVFPPLFPFALSELCEITRMLEVICRCVLSEVEHCLLCEERINPYPWSGVFGGVLFSEGCTPRSGGVGRLKWSRTWIQTTAQGETGDLGESTIGKVKIKVVPAKRRKMDRAGGWAQESRVQAEAPP